MSTTFLSRIKKQSYPLNEKSTGLGEKIFLLANPILFAMAANGVMSLRNTYMASICEESGAIEFFATIMLLSTLFGTITGPIGGRIGDLFGRRIVAIIGGALQMCALLCVGMANDVTTTMIAYALWGASTAFTTTFYTAGIADLFGAASRAKFIGLSNGLQALAQNLCALGFGVIADGGTNQFAMICMIAPIAIAWIYAILFFPNIKTQTKVAKFDVKGLVFMVLTIAPFTIALAMAGKQLPWDSPIIWLSFAFSIVCGVFFFKVEKNVEVPMFDFRLFGMKGYTQMVLWMGLIACGATLISFTTNYCRTVAGWSASDLSMLSFGTYITIVLAPIVGWVLSKSGKFKWVDMASPVCMVILGVVGFFCVTGTQVDIVPVVIMNVFYRACLVIGSVSTSGFIATAVRADQRGIALSLNTFFGTLIGTLSTAIFGAVQNALGGIEFAYSVDCIILIGVGIFGFFLLLFGARNVDMEKVEEEEKSAAKPEESGEPEASK